MADQTNPIDANSRQGLTAVSNVDGKTIVRLYADPITHRLLTDSAGGGTGTVTQIDSGTGIKLTPDPITTTGSIALVDRIAPIATLGSANQQIRVNAGATALEYFTPSTSSNITIGTTTITSGTTTRILYDNAGVVGEYTISGSGTVVAMATSPVLTTPTLGVASATSINKVAITAPTTSATLTIADGKTVTHNATTTFAGTDGKTLTVSNSGTLAGGDAFTLAIAASKTLTVSNTLTFTGMDSSSVAFGAGGTVLYSASTIPLTVGSTTIASGTTTRILYDNAGVLGEYTLSGSGTVVAMATAPTFTTSITTPSVLATANDSGALGASGTAFSDVFLASGGIINWAANNSNITHSTGILTVGAGEFRITSANVGSNADSVPTLSSTSTLANKRVTPRVLSASSYTTDTGSSINGDTQDMFIVTAQTGALKFNNPTGTPTDGQKIIFSVASSTTSARALTWDTAYGSTTVTLPTTTAATTATLTIGFIWSASKSLWQCVAVA